MSEGNFESGPKPEPEAEEPVKKNDWSPVEKVEAARKAREEGKSESEPPKTDWSRVEQRAKAKKAREVEDSPAPIAHPTDPLAQGLKAIEQREKDILAEKARLDEILKTRPLTDKEKEDFRKLIS